MVLLELVTDNASKIEGADRNLTHDESVREWLRQNPFMNRFESINFGEWSVDHTTPGFDPARLVSLTHMIEEVA